MHRSLGVRGQNSETRIFRNQKDLVMERKAITSFEDLEVFRRAYRLSLDIHRLSLSFPKLEQYEMAAQIRRASKSVCANIAEGFGKQRISTPEFGRYLAVAIGSAEEMRVWCRYCLDLGYVDEAIWQVWSNEYQEIAKMLQGLRRNWK